jgi:CRP-like cAMP-binding protein
MGNPLLRNLEARDEVSDAERAIIRDLTQSVRAYPARSDIVREGDFPTVSLLMMTGLSARYNFVADGKRQLSVIHIAGDFVDLHSLLLEPMDHGVVTLTDCTVASVPHDVLRRLTCTQPHLTRLLWLLTVIDGAIFRQRLVAASRLPAASQIARFLCEIYTRLENVGLARNHAFDLPITQQDLSDAMGLSLVHVNKCLQAMRQDGLLSWQGEKATILDWDRMSAEAEFDPTYLNLSKRRR